MTTTDTLSTHMDFDEQKKKFTSFLRASYIARKTKGVGLLDDGNFERLAITKGTLSKYGFDANSDDFWDILCPLLIGEGVLRSCDGRYLFFHKLEETNSSYRNLREKLGELDRQLPPSYSFAKSVSGKSTEEFLSSVVMLGVEKDHARKIENEMEKVREQLRAIEDDASQRLEFIVNGEKLLEDNIPSENRVTNTSQTLFVFTLNKDGLISRQHPLQGDTSYSMEKGSRRHMVMKVLAGSTSKFSSTFDLAQSVGCTEQQIRTACGEIRAEFRKHFSGLRPNDVIDSKARSGYRINPNARIALLP